MNNTQEENKDNTTFFIIVGLSCFILGFITTIIIKMFF